MKFGLFYEWPNPTLRNWKTLFDEGVEEIQYSEEMGFEYCLIAEHHFSNYGNSPSPLLQALYIGQRTKRIKIALESWSSPSGSPCAWRRKWRCWTILSTDGLFVASVGGTNPTRWGDSASRWRSLGGGLRNVLKC